MSAFCDNLHDLDPSIQVFGGGAFSGKLDAVQACVFSKKGSCMQKGVAFVLYGGDDKRFLYAKGRCLCAVRRR